MGGRLGADGDGGGMKQAFDTGDHSVGEHEACRKVTRRGMTNRDEGRQRHGPGVLRR